MAEVQGRREDMKKMQRDILKQKEEESMSYASLLEKDKNEKESLFIIQKIQDEKKIKENKLLEELEMMRRIRATEVVQDLIRRGIKKIGQAKISDIERKQEYDYDTIMNFYQQLLKKEKEQFEMEKNKKIKDVEFWARSMREEEKIITEKYCQQHGEEEMKQIQKAILDRHTKELKMK